VSMAPNANITLPLPAGLSYVSASGSGWSCAVATGTLTCNYGNLTGSAANALTLNFTAPSATGDVDLVFTAGSDATDANLTDNTVTFPLQIRHLYYMPIIGKNNP
ncbi:MAG: hypothetical protein HY835_07450, partial [Anaerolineae bacterium]|nr:hypothetical protein [Anaerolineae bacterium]